MTSDSTKRCSIWSETTASTGARRGACSLGPRKPPPSSAPLTEGVPIWSKYSCSRSVIEFQETAEAFAGLDLAG